VPLRRPALLQGQAPCADQANCKARAPRRLDGLQGGVPWDGSGLLRSAVLGRLRRARPGASSRAEE